MTTSPRKATTPTPAPPAPQRAPSSRTPPTPAATPTPSPATPPRERGAGPTRHTWKMLRHVREVIGDHPQIKSGTSHTWESVKDGVDRKLTISLSADGTTFNFELDLGLVPATGATTMVKVA